MTGPASLCSAGKPLEAQGTPSPAAYVHLKCMQQGSSGQVCDSFSGFYLQSRCPTDATVPESRHEVNVALHGRPASQRGNLVGKEADVLPIALRTTPLPRPVRKEEVWIALTALHEQDMHLDDGVLKLPPPYCGSESESFTS